MILDSYDTTACSGYDLKKITKELEVLALQSRFNGPIQEIEDNNIRKGQLILYPTLVDVPTWRHPLAIKLTGYLRPDETVYIIDGRPFISADSMGVNRVRAPMDLTTLKLRCKLQSIWTNHDPDLLLNCGPYQITLFTRWVADSLARGLALNPEAIDNTTIIIGHYYYCLFQDDADTLTRNLYAEAGLLSKCVYSTPDHVASLIENVGYIQNVSELINALKTHSGSIRFDNLNEAMLYTLTGNAWFGANAREILAVALEHPPTFLSLCYLSFNERGYRNTQIGKIAQQQSKLNQVAQIITSINSLLRTY